jgi:hypothetical protein
VYSQYCERASLLAKPRIWSPFQWACPYMETIRCLLRNTTNRAAGNRARRQAACQFCCGVHRRPSHLVLSHLFCPRISVSRRYFLNGMEEVVSSNLTRSTKTFHRVSVSAPFPKRRYGAPAGTIHNYSKPTVVADLRSTCRCTCCIAGAESDGRPTTAASRLPEKALRNS